MAISFDPKKPPPTLNELVPQWKDPTKEQIKIKEWRVQQLRKAGLDKRRAQFVASIPGVDYHAAIDMLEAGCSPALLIEILN